MMPENSFLHWIAFGKAKHHEPQHHAPLMTFSSGWKHFKGFQPWHILEQKWSNIPLSVCQIFLRSIWSYYAGKLHFEEQIIFFPLLWSIVKFKQDDLVRDFLLKGCIASTPRFNPLKKIFWLIYGENAGR